MMSKKTNVLLECIGCHQRYSMQELRMLPKQTFNIDEQKATCYCKSEALRIIIVQSER